MRQIVCGDFAAPLRCVETDDRAPGPGQVAIAVEACGVNYVDALIVTGRYQIQPPRPFTPGYEVAGRIDALGANVADFAVGDRVLATPGFGGYADRVVVGAARVERIPDTLTAGQAATFAQSYCTALFALRTRGGLATDETLLVLGAAGGVGRAAIDVGKALGARVVAAASSRARCEACTALGADATVDYGTEDLRSRIRELAPNGVDIVFDPVGDRLAESALRSLGYLGRYLVIGFAGGDIPRLPVNQVLLRNRAIVGVDWGAWAGAFPDEQRKLLLELLDLAGRGQLHPAEPTAYPFDRASDALADLVSRRVAGKIALVPGVDFVDIGART
jgi:NADPH2:quinone reductase